MFTVRSMVPLLLAVSLPFGNAAPADNRVPTAHAFALSDNTTNITGRGVTTDPAIWVTWYYGTTCGNEFGTATLPDATCYATGGPGGAASLVIEQFFGNCRFSKFAHTNHYGKL